MREGEEHDVVAGEGRGIRRLELQVGERAQVRLHGDERLPGVLERGHRGDVELGVGAEQAQHLTARIAAGTSHGDR